MTRAFWVWLHRWAGLAMALFLIIVGLTGSVLAFRDELDVWLNPELLTVAKRDAPMLDPFVLRDKTAALYPDAQIDIVPLDIKPDRSVGFVTMPGMTGMDDMMEKLVDVYLNPYTGEKLGERIGWSGPSLARKDIISFLYRLHFSLALPWSTGSLGGYILGVTALVWTIDCFIGFYLTCPLRWRVNGEALPGAKSWWSRWKPAWLIKLNAGAFRINLDIHRAFGLWTWLMLFVLAWSSVGFNLNQAYTPVMQTLFGLSDPMAGLPARAEPLDHPRLGWREAYATGHALLGEQAREHGFAIEKEKYLYYDRDHGVYVTSAQGTQEGKKSYRTSVTFDADTGAVLQAAWPGSPSEKTGDLITRWLIWLHTAAVFGLPMQIFVCIMGVVITVLSVTGIYIWWKKRRARRFSKARRGVAKTKDAEAAIRTLRLLHFYHAA